MKKVYFLLICCLSLGLRSHAQVDRVTHVNYDVLNNTHDLSLSPWGPYSKKYAGISHIPDVKSGLRFDFSVLPGYYRNKIFIPNVYFESGYFPWEANHDLTRYTFRYELEWKDQVFTDVTYTVVDSSTVLVAMHCVNNTSLPQNLALNLVAYVDYPENYPIKQISHSPGVLWKNAVDYQSMTFAKPRPTDNLVRGGWMRGEIRDSIFVDGNAVGQRFGRDQGDKATYEFNVGNELLKGELRVLFRMKNNAACTFRLSGLVNQKLTLKGTGNLEEISLPYSLSRPGATTLTLESEGGQPVELNGFLLVPENHQDQAMIMPLSKHLVPEKTENNDLKNILLKYKDIDAFYGIAWDGEPFEVREIKNDELDIYLRGRAHDHVHKVLNGNQKGDYANVFIRPVALKPQSEKTLYAVLCAGDYEQVQQRLRRWNDDLQHFRSSKENEPEKPAGILPEGQPYLFSQKMLQATLMTNIVYPIYTQRSYIRHFTPGKWWNSLYTWDVGFISLALNQINPALGTECLNTYTTPVGSQSAFIHFGTPVPVQMYAFFDLWNRTQSKEMLTYFYPQLKQYYDFMVGNYGSSTTRTLKSDLIRTWDYSYNVGWDDYPAQNAVHSMKKAQSVAAPSITAHCLRIAKILRMASQTLNKKDDIKTFDQDIKTFTDALQRYSWNSASGYYSYVEHDRNGYPAGRFKDPDSGLDYNMGLGGAYPLFSGICTPEQEKILLEKIFSEKHMWTPAGITVIDQAAPYYRIDGYWNGTVWMPHQWFMWKAMLDLGRPELASKIAQTALDIYEREIEASYYTFEHFFSETGRGAGWHQFSGLSSPILLWFPAYYKIGTVTTGFEIWIREQSFNPDFSSYQAKLSFDEATTPHQRSLLVCMDPSHSYQVTFNGKKTDVSSPYKGLLEITLPATNQEGVLSIQPAK